MIFDLDKNNSPETEFDVCVVGSGPAGITLALKLAAAGKKVLLLEGGGFSWSETSQKIYDCGTTGLDAWPQTTRLRYFGGTSNHWAGRCRPFEESDFQATYYDELPGWSIPLAEINPYLTEAMDILGLDDNGFSAINNGIENSEFVADRFALSPPTRFGEKYLEAMKASKNIFLYLNANVFELALDKPKRKVVGVKVKNQLGQTFSFSTSEYILAMGAIENARFLLNQDNEIKEGIGNESGMVGSCFMEHLNVMLGEFIQRDTDVTPPFQFFTSDHFSRKNSTGKANISFGVVRDIKSYGRTAKIKSFFKSLACNWSLEDKLQFIADFECPGTGVISTLIEQSPGKQSYVALGNETDSLGMRKAVLNWEINAHDSRTIRTVAVEIARSFAEAGLGVVKLKDYILDESAGIPVGPHAHHMGTTRMASAPEFGVVDQNCKVFGIENLYIAGSSIFATGGASNPTMPIVQFSLRLAEHLTRKFESGYSA